MAAMAAAVVVVVVVVLILAMGQAVKDLKAAMVAVQAAVVVEVLGLPDQIFLLFQ
jgi:hypothetical protein